MQNSEVRVEDRWGTRSGAALLGDVTGMRGGEARSTAVWVAGWLDIAKRVQVIYESLSQGELPKRQAMGAGRKSCVQPAQLHAYASCENYRIRHLNTLAHTIYGNTSSRPLHPSHSSR